MNTTILLPVSRKEFLPEVFQSLEDLKCDIAHTALLCIVNGEADLFVEARNYCESSKFAERLCIQLKPKNKLRKYDIGGRRKRIAAVHNLAKTHINTEYVFGVEDDTIVPPEALERLGEQYVDDIGVIEGVEMGRWGVPYIGAWRADDIEDPQTITSIPKESGTVEVDGCGFYCFLTKSAYYKGHDFKVFSGGLGPDIDYSIDLRRRGYRNLADFSVECIHLNDDGAISFDNTEPRQIKMIKKRYQWLQNLIY